MLSLTQDLQSECLRAEKTQVSDQRNRTVSESVNLKNGVRFRTESESSTKNGLGMSKESEKSENYTKNGTAVQQNHGDWVNL